MHLKNRPLLSTIAIHIYPLLVNAFDFLVMFGLGDHGDCSSPKPGCISRLALAPPDFVVARRKNQTSIHSAKGLMEGTANHCHQRIQGYPEANIFQERISEETCKEKHISGEENKEKLGISNWFFGLLEVPVRSFDVVVRQYIVAQKIMLRLKLFYHFTIYGWGYV